MIKCVLKSLTISALLLCGAMGSACHVYHPDVQQGNALDPEMIAALKVGMTRFEVRRVLGNSLMQTNLSARDWDYLYVFRTKGKLKEQRRLTLHFDEQDRLESWDEKSPSI